MSRKEAAYHAAVRLVIALAMVPATWITLQHGHTMLAICPAVIGLIFAVNAIDTFTKQRSGRS